MAIIPIGDAPYTTVEFTLWLKDFKQYLIIPYIEDGSITTSKLSDNSVTTDKIADYNVTESKLANNSVIETNFINGSITADKISSTSNIDSNKFQDGSITSSKIFGEIATNTNFINLDITSNDFANNSIAEAILIDSSIDETKFASNTIDNSKFQTNAIGNAKFVDSAIVTSNLAYGTITGSNFVNENVNYGSNDFVNGTISSIYLANNCVTNAKVINDTIFDAVKFGKDSIANSKLYSYTLPAQKFFKYGTQTYGKTTLLNNDKEFRNTYTGGENIDEANIVVSTNTYELMLFGFTSNFSYGNIECINQKIKSDVHVQGTFCVQGDTVGNTFAIALVLEYYDDVIKLTKNLKLQEHYFTITDTNNILPIPLNGVLTQELVDEINGYPTLVGDSFSLSKLKINIYRISGAGTLTINLASQRSSYVEMEL